MIAPPDVYAPPATATPGADPAAPRLTGGLYVVSPRKMLVLFVATLGFYGVAWFYCHFTAQKRRYGDDSWPIVRSLFSIFFAHKLFGTIAAARLERDWGGGFDSDSAATAFVVLSISQRILDRVSMKMDEPLLDVAAVGLGLAVAFPLLRAQISANVASGDPHGDTNARLTLVNHLWCLPGVVTWLGLGLLLAEQILGPPF